MNEFLKYVLATMVIPILLFIVFAELDLAISYMRFYNDVLTPDHPLYLSSSIGDALYPSIDIDNNDNPHFVWHQGNERKGNIVYAHYDKNRVFQKLKKEFFPTYGVSLFRRSSCRPNIVVDEKEGIHLSWYTGYNIYYIKKGDQSWSNRKKSYYSGNDFSRFLRNTNHNLSVDAFGIPHVLWGKEGLNAEKLINDSWENILVETPDLENTIYDKFRKEDVKRSELEFDSNGNPVIVWTSQPVEDEYDYILNLAKFDDNNWKNIYDEELDLENNNTEIGREGASIYDFSFELDRNDNPRVVWLEADSDSYWDLNMIYARWDGEKWLDSFDNETFSDESYIEENIPVAFFYHGNQVKLKLGKDDCPYIAFRNTKKDESYHSTSYIAIVKKIDDCWEDFAWNDDKFTTKKNILTNWKGSVFEFDFDLDRNDYPHVVFSSWAPAGYHFSLDSADFRIHYVKWDGENWVMANGKRYR